jgi:hypothetical protein
MYSFLKYKRAVTPNQVVTVINSEPKENGATEWNQMTFTNLRPITSEEADVVIGHIKEIKESVDAEKAFYASKAPAKNDDF